MAPNYAKQNVDIIDDHPSRSYPTHHPPRRGVNRYFGLTERASRKLQLASNDAVGVPLGHEEIWYII